MILVSRYIFILTSFAKKGEPFRVEDFSPLREIPLSGACSAVQRRTSPNPQSLRDSSFTKEHRKGDNS
jgi:hypothetical protein